MTSESRDERLERLRRDNQFDLAHPDDVKWLLEELERTEAELAGALEALKDEGLLREAEDEEDPIDYILRVDPPELRRQKEADESFRQVAPENGSVEPNEAPSGFEPLPCSDSTSTQEV